MLFDMFTLGFMEDDDDDGNEQYGWNHTRKIDMAEFFGSKI